MSYLISDQDMVWAKELKEKFSAMSVESEVVANGKDCQLKLYQNKIDVMILDLDTQNHSGLEVLRYLRMTKPNVRVLLTFGNQDRMNDYEMNEEKCQKLGTIGMLVRPYSFQDLVDKIENSSEAARWKKMTAKENTAQDVQYDGSDEEFTKIEVSSFCSGNVTIFDLYLRLGTGKYVKILHQGESFDENRILTFQREKKVEYFYFKTEDRLTYVNFINDLIAKRLDGPNPNNTKSLRITRSASEMFLEELYTSGINENIVSEGKKLCDSVSKIIGKNKKLTDLIAELQNNESNHVHAHQFLTSFLAVVIVKNLDWGRGTDHRECCHGRHAP